MNKPMQEQSKINAKPLTQTPGLLFEMIRSFVTLSQTLNLSRAVEQLGSTRQTVRRHISQLEEMMGGALFVVEDRRYHLSELGEQALPGATEIMDRGTLWSRGETLHSDGTLRLQHEAPNGWNFYQQQRPLTQIWDAKSPLLRRALVTWSESAGQLESPLFQTLRPYVLVYRDTPSGWICVEVGERSFYAGWWGWANARSSIGRPLGKFPGGEEFEALLTQPFSEVQQNGGARLDEVATQIPREEGGPPIPLVYKRLLLGARFPDHSFALIAVVDRADKVTISGLDQGILGEMPPDAQVDFEGEDLNIGH